MKRGRRSDHTREQLRTLLATEGCTLLSEKGLSGFSARELARRIGYSVTTVIAAHGGQDGLIAAINTHSFDMWTQALQEALMNEPDDRIRALVEAYFDFAERHPLLWRSIYEHRLPDGVPTADQAERRGRLTRIVVDEIERLLGDRSQAEIVAPSLIATVHGHCHLWVTGASDLMGMDDPKGCALARIRQTLDALRQPVPKTDRSYR